MSYVGKLVEYNVGRTILEGFLAIPSYVSKNDVKLPAVIIYPTYEGRNEFVEGRATELAKV